MVSRRRSISDIVAVIMLVIIAIAAAAIIYAWLSGFLGGLRSSSGSVTAVKLQITGASASVSSSSDTATVTVYLYNPTGSAPTTISQAILEFSNGTVIASSSSILLYTSATSSAITSITPNEAATADVTFSASSIPSIPAGTPVQIVVYTPSGYSTSYQFSWP